MFSIAFIVHFSNSSNMSSGSLSFTLLQSYRKILYKWLLLDLEEALTHMEKYDFLVLHAHCTSGKKILGHTLNVPSLNQVVQFEVNGIAC